MTSSFKSACRERLFEHALTCDACTKALFSLEYNKPTEISGMLCEEGKRLAQDCDAEDQVNELLKESRKRDRK